jgi:hypothetical protein
MSYERRIHVCHMRRRIHVCRLRLSVVLPVFLSAYASASASASILLQHHSNHMPS